MAELISEVLIATLVVLLPNHLLSVKFVTFDAINRPRSVLLDIKAGELDSHVSIGDICPDGDRVAHVQLHVRLLILII